MKKHELSHDQTKAFDFLMDFWKSTKREKPYVSLGGFAGTGKSFLISRIAEAIRSDSENTTIAFCAFTGKAAQVLSEKLGTIPEGDFCGTIHSLIYQPIVVKNIIKGWKRKDAIPFQLIMLDESSMVDGDLFSDLLKFGIPIMAFGDHGQLPPVSGRFNLMTKPDVRIETIHRQAENHPIIQLSMIVRQTGRIPVKEFAPGVKKIRTPNLYTAVQLAYSGLEPKRIIQDAFICGFNATRVYLNKTIRQSVGIHADAPIKGDKVICLRNNRNLNIFNGMMGTIEEFSCADKTRYTAKIRMDGNGLYEGLISRFQFGQKQTPENWNTFKQGDLFDFGYCCTVHKSQGSESKSVVFIEERLPNMDDRDYGRFLYTAVTRARERLLVIERSNQQ